MNLKYRLFSASVFAFFFLFFPLYCYCQVVSSTELINNARLYDGKTVIYAGEVIGGVMRRGANAWVNINDGNNAIGVWVNGNLVKDIVYSGSYKSRGDKVEVTGVFHRACPEHGGDLDIHAEALKKINSGRILSEKINTGKVKVVSIFLGVLCLILILKFLSRK